MSEASELQGLESQPSLSPVPQPRGTFVEKAGPKDIAEHISLLDGVFQSAKPLLAQDGCIWMTLLSSGLAKCCHVLWNHVTDLSLTGVWFD